MLAAMLAVGAAVSGRSTQSARSHTVLSGSTSPRTPMGLWPWPTSNADQPVPAGQAGELLALVAQMRTSSKRSNGSSSGGSSSSNGGTRFPHPRPHRGEKITNGHQTPQNAGALLSGAGAPAELTSAFPTVRHPHAFARNARSAARWRASDGVRGVTRL